MVQAAASGCSQRFDFSTFLKQCACGYKKRDTLYSQNLVYFLILGLKPEYRGIRRGSWCNNSQYSKICLLFIDFNNSRCLWQLFAPILGWYFSSHLTPSRSNAAATRTVIGSAWVACVFSDKVSTVVEIVERENNIKQVE